jgi:hypothetical protein
MMLKIEKVPTAVWTSATRLAVPANEIISQAAPNHWINQPKFETVTGEL